MAERKGYLYTELQPQTGTSSEPKKRLKSYQQEKTYHARRGGTLSYKKDTGQIPRVVQHRFTGRVYVVGDAAMLLSELVADNLRATMQVRVAEGKVSNGAKAIFSEVTKRLEVTNAKARTATGISGSDAVIVNNNSTITIGGDINGGSLQLGGARTRTNVKGFVSYLQKQTRAFVTGDHKLTAKEIVVNHLPPGEVRVRETGRRRVAATR